MRCGKCGNENAPGLHFCEQCAAPVDAPSPVAIQPETIKCVKCGTLNRPGIKFCEQCAAPLGAPLPAAMQAVNLVCPNCGTLNRLEVKFCEQCAAPITPKSTTRPTRRRVTVTFGISVAAVALVLVGVIGFLLTPGESPQSVRHQPQMTQEDGLRGANEIVMKSFPAFANAMPIVQETTFGADKGYRYLYRTGQPVKTEEGLIDTQPSVTIIVNAVTKKVSVMVAR